MNLAVLKEINDTVKMANEIAAQAGEGPRWSMYATNRSFVAQVMLVVFLVFGSLNVDLPFVQEQAVDIVCGVGALASAAWALVERLNGKTKVVWNKTLAEAAVAEAEALKKGALAKTLDRAIRGTQR